MLTSRALFLAALSLLHFFSVQGSCIGGGEEPSLEDACNEAGYTYCASSEICYSTWQSEVSTVNEAKAICNGLQVGTLNGKLFGDLYPRYSVHHTSCLAIIASAYSSRTYFWYDYDGNSDCNLMYNSYYFFWYLYVTPTSCPSPSSHHFFCEFR